MFWGDAARKTEQAQALAEGHARNTQAAQANRPDIGALAFAAVLGSVFSGGSPTGGMSDVDRIQQMNRQDISD